MIRSHLKAALIAAAIAAFAAAAAAQPGPGPGRGPGYGPGPGMMGGGPGYGPGPGMMGGGPGRGMMGAWNLGSYLDALKPQLGITPQQEPAWKEYADTASSVGDQMQALHQAMFQSMGTASWQERRDMMDEMFQSRQQAYDTVHQAAENLVAQLTPAQQAKARGILPGLVRGPGMMGAGGPGGPRGPAR